MSSRAGSDLGKWLQSCTSESSAKRLQCHFFPLFTTVRFVCARYFRGRKKAKKSNSEFNVISIVSDQVQTFHINPVHSSCYIVFVIFS